MDDLKTLRELVESKRDSRGYVRVTGEAKPRIVSYLKQRRDAGETVDAVAADLGVSKTSLERWSRGHSLGGTKGRRMRAVTVSSPAPTWVVRGPCGLRVEGMDVAGLSELLRRLS